MKKYNIQTVNGVECLRPPMPNRKRYFKYIIDKKLYDLFDYCIIHNQFHMDFFSTNPNYKEIWSELRIAEKYGYCNLVEMEYDEKYNCYVIEVVAADLLAFARGMHKAFHNCNFHFFRHNAEGKGWVDIEEIFYDYSWYM